MQKMQEMQFQSLGQEDPLEKWMTTHSSIFAWKKSHGQRVLVGYSPCSFTESWARLNIHSHKWCTNVSAFCSLPVSYSNENHTFKLSGWSVSTPQGLCHPVMPSWVCSKAMVWNLRPSVHVLLLLKPWLLQSAGIVQNVGALDRCYSSDQMCRIDRVVTEGWGLIFCFISLKMKMTL